MTRTVLVVDDDDDIREITRLALEMVMGWRVLAAADGFEALDLARSERPDAVLMDVMMPGMDGPTTVGRMRQDDATRDVPVILLTAKAQSGDRRQFEDLGVAGVISKPFDPMTLAATASRILGWSAG